MRSAEIVGRLTSGTVRPATMSPLFLEGDMDARLVVIAAVGLSLGAGSPQDPASEKDLAALQGTWHLVSAMKDGKALSREKDRRTTIVFKGDTFRFPGLAEDATSQAGTIK